MSGGCHRCAAYGSKEQRLSAARRIAAALASPMPGEAAVAILRSGLEEIGKATRDERIGGIVETALRNARQPPPSPCSATQCELCEVRPAEVCKSCVNEAVVYVERMSKLDGIETRIRKVLTSNCAEGHHQPEPEGMGWCQDCHKDLAPLLRYETDPDPTDFDALAAEALLDPVIRAAYDENKKRRQTASSFKYESNRSLYSLRIAAYDDVKFTSADAARCSDVLYAINHDRERPKEQRSKDPKEDVALLREWNRVMEIASSNELTNVQAMD